VTALRVGSSQGGGSYGEESNGRGSLIAPGASHEIRFTHCNAQQVSPNESAPCAFIFEAALFADGSYEGDASAAASMEARRIAQEFYSNRIQELISSIITDSTLTESSKIARIRTEVPKLSEQPDRAILQQLRVRFPSLPPAAWGSVNSSISVAMAFEKQNTLRSLDAFLNSPTQGSSTRSLANWWSDWQRNQ